jgi:hypothetical protein
VEELAEREGDVHAHVVLVRGYGSFVRRCFVALANAALPRELRAAAPVHRRVHPRRRHSP